MTDRKKSPLRFRQHEAERLIRAARAAGIEVGGIELLADGSIRVIATSVVNQEGLTQESRLKDARDLLR
jgi:hypothetical protein